MLFTVFYVVQIIHSENFWKWFIVPGTAYAVERVLRSKPVHLARYGRTYIVQGNAMPSKVYSTSTFTVCLVESFDEVEIAVLLFY